MVIHWYATLETMSNIFSLEVSLGGCYAIRHALFSQNRCQNSLICNPLYIWGNTERAPWAESQPPINVLKTEA